MFFSKQISSRAHKARLIAFLTHLTLSLSLFAILLAIIYFAWFPHALFEASGGLEGITIIAAVDIVLGPLLTLVVYDITKTKWHLVRDIGVITALQLSCLVAGTLIVNQAKPIAVVHVYDTFHVISKPDFNSRGIDPSPLTEFTGSYPKILYTATETNPIAFLTKSTLDKLNKKIPLQWRLSAYRAIPQNAEEINRILQSSKAASRECITQNITSRYTSGTVCFNPNNLIFTDFKEGQSIPLLNKAEIKVQTAP